MPSFKLSPTLTVRSPISNKPVLAATNFAGAVPLVITYGISVTGDAHIKIAAFC